MQKIKLNNFNTLICTVFGVGLSPKAPGTWGSLAGMLGALLLVKSPIVMWEVVFIGFILGLMCIPKLIKNQTQKDPGYIVIDEFVAQIFVFACLPIAFLNPITWILGFVLFRLFDIFKPWPASFYDQKMHNALGIMMDDIVAALFTLLTLLIIILLSF